MRELAADYLVVALPASTLKHVVFRPSLPEEQWRAITKLRYGPATRVLLQFDRRFLRRLGRLAAYGSDQDFGAIWDANEQQRGKAGILWLLAGVFAGEHTSDRGQGYMNGAIESGKRAGIEVAMMAGLNYERVV